MSTHDQPFIGSEARRDGRLRHHQLRAGYAKVFPDVYFPRGADPTMRQRAAAAWLWSHRGGVLAGLSAAACHGSKWVDGNLPIELIWSNHRAPHGIRTYDVRLSGNEACMVSGLPMTTPQRTAFDIGRRKPLGRAVARMDALLAATGVKADEVGWIVVRVLADDREADIIRRVGDARASRLPS